MNFRKYMMWLFSFAIAFTMFAVASESQEDASSERQYVRSSQCKLCHNKQDEGQQYNVWKSMRHSHAFATLLSDAAIKVAQERGLQLPPSESSACLKCHVTGYDADEGSHPEQLKLEDSIQCDSCHGPGSAHLADGKILRMNKDADIDVMANLLLPTSETCVACHNPESPTWNPEKYTLESGEKAGFSFEEAVKIIAHMNPKKTKS